MNGSTARICWPKSKRLSRDARRSERSLGGPSARQPRHKKMPVSGLTGIGTQAAGCLLVRLLGAAAQAEGEQGQTEQADGGRYRYFRIDDDLTTNAGKAEDEGGGDAAVSIAETILIGIAA